MGWAARLNQEVAEVALPVALESVFAVLNSAEARPLVFVPWQWALKLGSACEMLAWIRIEILIGRVAPIALGDPP